MKKAGFYDVHKSTGEFVKRIKLTEDACEKIINIKINNLFDLKPTEYYLKRSKNQED